MSVHGWIYKITNTVNGKVYIGQTIQKPRIRFSQHRCLLKKNDHPNDHLQASWNKYGKESFTFEVIEKFDPEMNFDLDMLERTWIKYYDSNNRLCGYNISLGGASGSGCIPWNKGLRGAGVCKANSGSFKKGQTSPNKGKKLSAEQRQRQSDKMKGRPSANRKRVLCLNNNQEYVSAEAAAKEFGMSFSAVCQVCRGKMKSAKGYSFKYIDGDIS